VWLPISIVAKRHSPSLPPPSQEDGSGLSLSLVIKSSKKKRNGWDSETYISLWLLSQLKLVFIEISCPVSVCLKLIVFWCASNDFLLLFFSLLEAIDLILEGAQNLVIPLHNPFTRKKLISKSTANSTLHNNREYCWLTQEDIVRYLLNSIGLFSPTPNHTIESLNIIDTESFFTVHYDDPAALPLISQSLVKQTSVAILDADGKLIGEISPFTLNFCDETVAAAIATLSAGELMAYIECGDPPEDLIMLVKERLGERNLGPALDLIEEESGILSSSSDSSYSSASDEEFGMGRSGRIAGNSARVGRSTETIVCYPWSSLVAVMIQALSHRLSYTWVIEEDGTLVGVVTFAGMIKVLRERLRSMVWALFYGSLNI